MRSTEWLLAFSLLTLGRADRPAPLPAAPAALPAPPEDVDWSRGVVTARGLGPPEVWRSPGGASRDLADRAAREDALRRLRSRASSLSISGRGTLGELLVEPQVRGRIEAALRRFTVRRRRWFSDGGVLLDVEVPLAALVRELDPPAAQAELVHAPEPTAPSFILDATAAGPRPMLEPRIVGPSGEVLLDGTNVAGERHRLPFAYVASLAEAQRLFGARLPVFRVESAQAGELKLSTAEAKRWEKSEEVRKGRGVVVTLPSTLR